MAWRGVEEGEELLETPASIEGERSELSNARRSRIESGIVVCRPRSPIRLSPKSVSLR